jgi:hypothetical protein
VIHSMIDLKRTITTKNDAKKRSREVIVGIFITDVADIAWRLPVLGVSNFVVVQKVESQVALT